MSVHPLRRRDPEPVNDFELELAPYSDEERIDGRIPPSDPHAERAVITAAFLDPDRCSEAVGLLRPEHFFENMNARIFAAIAALHAEGTAIDETTVQSRLREEGRLAEVDWPRGITAIITSSPAIRNVAAYARAIRDAWRMRQLIALTREVQARAYGSQGDRRATIRDGGFQSAQGLLDEAHDRVFALAGDSAVHTAQTGKQLAREVFTYALDLNKRALEGGLSGVPTGFTALDRMLTGLHAPELVLLGALPSMGKTALLMGIALGAARRGVGVAFFSLEMPPRDVMLRAACAEACISMHAIRSGTLGSRVYDFNRAVMAIADLPIWWDGMCGQRGAQSVPTVMELMAKAQRLRAASRSTSAPIGLVVVDYLQKIRAPHSRKEMTRHDIVAHNCVGLKLLATRLDVPVLAAAALNRESTKTIKNGVPRKPQMSDLRESGAAEYEADGILLLHRDDYLRERGEAGSAALTGDADVIVGKWRNGATGSVKLRFCREFTRFEDMPEDYA
jgi:replicative DNA helicase